MSDIHTFETFLTWPAGRRGAEEPSVPARDSPPKPQPMPNNLISMKMKA